MIILGIDHNSHDAAASLLIDGKIVAIAEEERFTRKKHDGSVPVNAARFCLDYAGINPSDIDYLTFFYNPFLMMRKRVRQMARYFPASLQLLQRKAGSQTRMERIRMFMGENWLLRRALFHNQPGLRYKFKYVEHHWAHAASAFHLSPFDSAAILSIDGAGEWATTWLGRGEGNEIKLIRQVNFPHSVGLLYSALTFYLGFRPWSGEGKVMGLAAYGDPQRYLPTMRRIIFPTGKGGFKQDMSYFEYHVRGWQRWVSEKFIAEFGPLRAPESELEQRHKDIAAALQAITEEIGLYIVDELYKQTGEENLCLAGGVALNCVMNGRILQESKFKNIFIQPMASDAGTSLGSAVYANQIILRQPRVMELKHVYYGPEFTDQQCEEALKAKRLKYHRYDDIAKKTAELLAQEKIIGWFQGRMEVGPRALGCRSILTDPRKPEMKDILNDKVKHREGFRPFAPSVLEDKADQYFENPYPSPYMILNFKVLPKKRDVIPAVTHVDGTARVQTVSGETNPLYYRLIEEFEKLTGVAVILNTSFNVRGEPIVCTPSNAIDCFLGTQMDYLVLGNFIAEKG